VTCQLLFVLLAQESICLAGEDEADLQEEYTHLPRARLVLADDGEEACDISDSRWAVGDEKHGAMVRDTRALQHQQDSPMERE
jgi:hypothetical protein